MLTALSDLAGITQNTELQMILLTSLFISGLFEPSSKQQLDMHAQRIQENMHREFVEAALKIHTDRYRTARLIRERQNHIRQH